MGRKVNCIHFDRGFCQIHDMPWYLRFLGKQQQCKVLFEQPCYDEVPNTRPPAPPPQSPPLKRPLVEIGGYVPMTDLTTKNPPKGTAVQNLSKTDALVKARQYVTHSPGCIWSKIKSCDCGCVETLAEIDTALSLPPREGDEALREIAQEAINLDFGGSSMARIMYALRKLRDRHHHIEW